MQTKLLFFTSLNVRVCSRQSAEIQKGQGSRRMGWEEFVWHLTQGFFKKGCGVTPAGCRWQTIKGRATDLVPGGYHM